jgi:hypothetical protein
MCYETRAQVHRNCILGVQHVSPVQGDIGELCRRSVTKPTAGWTVGARRAFPQVEPVPKSRFDTSRTGRYCLGLRGVVCPNLQPDAVGGFFISLQTPTAASHGFRAGPFAFPEE